MKISVQVLHWSCVKARTHGCILILTLHCDPCVHIIYYSIYIHVPTHPLTIFSPVAVWPPSCEHRHERAEVWLLSSQPDLRHQGQCNLHFSYINSHCAVNSALNNFTVFIYVAETFQLVSITNHTAGVLVCVWVTTDTDNFHVVPDEREIAAGKTASFAVKFKPVRNTYMYLEQLYM